MITKEFLQEVYGFTFGQAVEIVSALSVLEEHKNDFDTRLQVSGWFFGMTAMLEGKQRRFLFDLMMSI